MNWIKKWWQTRRDRRADWIRQRAKIIIFWEEIGEIRDGKISNEESLARRSEWYDVLDEMSTDEILGAKYGKRI